MARKQAAHPACAGLHGGEACHVPGGYYHGNHGTRPCGLEHPAPAI